MDEETFNRWLDAYGRAWEDREPRAVAALFAEDAVYYVTPFADPMLGRAAIIRYWETLPNTQNYIEFNYEILSVTQEMGIAQFWAEFTRLPSSAFVKIDGVYVISLDSRGLCKNFHQWWHEEETAAEPNDDE
jgi:hypothetical protein